MRRLRSLFMATALALSGPFVVVAAPALVQHAAAVTCVRGYVTFYDLANAQGAHSNLFCLDIPTRWNLDSSRVFTNGIAMNNKIESMKFQGPLQGGYIELWTDGLYGGYTMITSGGGPNDVIVDMPYPMINSISSITAGQCGPGGTDCHE